MVDTRVAIIGGGVMGLGVGWLLAEAGADVTLFERGKVGDGASRAAAGMLAPTAELEFHELELLQFAIESQRRWPAFASKLEAAAGVDVELERSGTLVLAVDRDDAEGLQRALAHQLEMGLEVEWLSGRRCRKLEPLLSPRLAGGIHCPGDWQVSNRRYVEALATAFVRAGGELREGSDVHGVVRAPTSGRIAGVTLADGSTFEAESVLIASGAWSRALEESAGVPLPLRPVKGEMLALQMDPKNPLCTHVLRGPDAYLVPKRDGTLVIGATVEEHGFDASLRAGGMRRLLEGAWEVLPGIDELPVKETWTGFRPACHDSGPMLGATGVEGLFTITGHYRNGIQQSPLSIEVVARVLMGHDLDEVARPFAATRFGGDAQ